MSFDDLVRMATARLEAAGVTPETATMRETLREAVESVPEILARLGGIASGAAPPLSVRSTIGQGGMGIVALGTQHSLGRDVALKTLSDGERDPRALAHLVREAVVTGSLEHPNIVPVHDLVLGPAGAPVMVMKRIVGKTWTAHLRSSDERTGAGAQLLAHLETLMSICRAIHFAHSRGVVHCDLKPDNVMVGGFGEVYVLDWGIAVDVSSPHALGSRREEIVGTPAYLAPEMLTGEALSPRTDVYQLGGLLYELLTGRAPHDVAGTTRDVVESVLRSPPELPVDAPPELAALTRACMQLSPEARPASAEAVRVALEEFVRHRGSVLVASRASERHAVLERELGKPRADVDLVQRLYGEVSFGFRVALDTWPENEAARDGLRRAVRSIVRHELASGSPKAARVRLAELDAPDDELRAEVERANELADARALADAKMRTEHDPATGRRARLASTMLITGLWTIEPLLQQAGVFGPNADTSLGGIVEAGLLAVVWAAAVLLLRRELLRSHLNRQLAAIGLLVLVIQAVGYGGAALLGLPGATTQTILLFVWFVVAALIGVAFERGVIPAAFAFLVAFFVAARAPSLRLVAESVANLVLMVTAFVAWREPRR